MLNRPFVVIGSVTVVIGAFMAAAIMFATEPGTSADPASETKRSCCSPTAAFASLGTDEAFRDAHVDPVAHVEADASIHDGHPMKIDIPDGEPATVWWYHTHQEPVATILVIHEWWGLNDQIRSAAHKLFNDLGGRVQVIAVDLYDEVVVTTAAEASKAMQANEEARSRAILQAVLREAGPHPVGTVGWCFGGGWSLQASLMAGERAAACVMYYGMPEEDVEKLKTLQAPVLGIFAKQDDWITLEVMRSFERSMKAAGKDLTTAVYDAKHAFANPSNPQFDEKATADAWAKTIAFFKEHLALK
jgi:carboxymethylenebutenolidase